MMHKAASNNRQLENREHLFHLRVATQADSKTFKKYLSDMEMNKKVSEKKDKTMTRQELKGLARMLGGK